MLRVHQIEQEELSQRFKRALQAAGRHLQTHGQGGINWIRATLRPPMIEHLSFRIGNQLIFVFVEAAEFELNQWKECFLKLSKEASAIPCYLPMLEKLTDFEPAKPGWGLIHAVSEQMVDPLGLVSDERILMLGWEPHDFAIEVVKGKLEEEGKNVYSAQSALRIDPSMWFEELRNSYWVVVRAARYPELEAPVPENIGELIKDLASESERGYFASVGIVSMDDPFDPEAKNNGNYIPLYRGHGMHVRYEGLREV